MLLLVTPRCRCCRVVGQGAVGLKEAAEQLAAFREPDRWTVAMAAVLVVRIALVLSSVDHRCKHEQHDSQHVASRSSGKVVHTSKLRARHKAVPGR